MLAQGSVGSGVLSQQASATSHRRPRGQLQVVIGFNGANGPDRGCMSVWELGLPPSSCNSGRVSSISELFHWL